MTTNGTPTMTEAQAESTDLQLRVVQHYNRLLRESLDLTDVFVDPLDAYRDQGGQMWEPLGSSGDPQRTGRSGFNNERELTAARNECRQLAFTNEFAINAHENRISYIVDTGHTYTAVAKKDQAVAPELAAAVQVVIDEFCYENAWQRRQQEIVRRIDRDGEIFLRFFVGADGVTRVRFVEPWQVSTPKEVTSACDNFGIATDPEDRELVLSYYIDGEEVRAVDIQHRKANVDANVKRGVPLMFPVRLGLKRAETILRNIAAGVGIQTAIALLRKHANASGSTVDAFRRGLASVSSTNPTTAATQYAQHYAAGSIVDASGQTDYQYLGQYINFDGAISALACILRAIASRLVMPEFMLTSDASNANYASTMVAEGPAVKLFSRLQAAQAEDDLHVMWRVIDGAIAAGRLPPEAESLIEVQVGKPGLAVRNQIEEENIRQIRKNNGVLSPQTWSSDAGLDYAQEQANLKEHQESTLDLGLPPLGQEVQPGAEPTAGMPVADAASEVLNGAQITAASAIVTAVVAGQMPRDSALGQLQVFFGMTPQEAAMVLGSAGTGVAVKPNPNAAPAEAPVLENCGTGAGGFKPGNTCPAGGGGGSSKVRKPRGPAKPKPTKKPTKDAARSERAKESHNPSTAEKQTASDEFEDEAASVLGATRSGDNRPMDNTMMVGGKEVGIEVKMMHDAKDQRVNMRPDSRQRKEDWMQENETTAWVLCRDNRDSFQGGAHADKHSGHDLYLRQGVGAFSLSTMRKVKDLSEAKRIIRRESFK